MAKYNIYRIHKNRERELLEKLEAVGLKQVGQKTVGDFTLSLYLSIEPRDIDIWWIEIYRDYLGDMEDPKNKSYYAVFLITSNALSYAISMGKSHFYLAEYCDRDFGINLAERIVDSTSLKLKNSKLFGGKRTKAITAYEANSDFEFDSGESIYYVKANTTDEHQWGKEASFGTSVQLHRDLSPDDLPELVTAIERELLNEPSLRLPRATAIKDAEKISKLDLELARALVRGDDASLQPAEAVVSGVDFIFLDQGNYRFIFNRRGKNVEGELSIQSLTEFIKERGINLEEDIDEIKIKVSGENNNSYTKSLKHFLDYVDDERHFLLDGRWHVFNQNYIEFLNEQIDHRITLEPSDINLSRTAFERWRQDQENQEGSTNVLYYEAYFNRLRENEGYLNLDRDISILQGYSIEKLDLYKDDTAFFVKIGTPQKFAYVVDQALATIRILQNRVAPLVVNGEEINPKRICLWLILDRQSRVLTISQIRSLILMMKLGEWQRQCSNAGYEPVVRIGYKVA